MNTATAQKLSNEQLDAIIRPMARAGYETDIPFNHLEEALTRYAEDWGGVNLEPDFQRGHVWSTQQQTAFIENLLRGVVNVAGILIQWNCPHWEESDYRGELARELQCVDGLQRLTAVRKYIAGQIKPFGLSVHELNDTPYSIKRGLWRLRFAIHHFGTRAELLQHYLDLNAGGTPHSPEELQRVRALLKECLPP